MTKTPIIRQIAWSSIVPRVLVICMFIALLEVLTDLPSKAIVWSVLLAYLGYAFAARHLIARAHSRGMRRVKAGDFAGAISHFEESYRFFSRYEWLDRFRYLLLFSSVTASYREMALVNIAFCYSQLGDGAKCRAYYEGALEAFPESGVAMAGLNMARSFERA